MRYNYVWLGLITPNICKLRMDNAWALSLTKCWLYVIKNASRCFHPKNFDIPKKMIINACRSCWWFCQILNRIKKLCVTLAFLAISVSGRDVCLTAAPSWVISVQEAMMVSPQGIFVQQDLNETDYVDFDKRSRWLHKIIIVYSCWQYHV